MKEEYELECDLFDLRALAPLNLDRIRDSVSKTGRLVVVHERRRNAGFGAELVSRITEKQFFDLDAPPLRITSQDMPIPFAPELETDFRPDTNKILNALIDWIETD